MADIKEDDIFDRFVSECLENAAWNTSIDVFVEKGIYVIKEDKNE